MLLLTSPSSPCLQACGSQEARRIATPCFLLRCGSGRARRARLLCFRQQKEWYRYGSSMCRSPQSTSRRRNKIHDLHNLTIPTPSPLCNTSLATLPFHPPSSLFPQHSRRSPRGDHQLLPPPFPDRGSGVPIRALQRGNKSENPSLVPKPPSQTEERLAAADRPRSPQLDTGTYEPACPIGNITRPPPVGRRIVAVRRPDIVGAPLQSTVTSSCSSLAKRARYSRAGHL